MKFDVSYKAAAGIIIPSIILGFAVHVHPMIFMLMGTIGYCFHLYLTQKAVSLADKPLSRSDKPTNCSTFRNPANGYEEKIDRPGLWCLLFGPFYFASKGVWTHAVVSAALAIVSFGTCWLLYPFFAREIMAKSYLRKGWLPVTENNLVPASVNEGVVG